MSHIKSYEQKRKSKCGDDYHRPYFAKKMNYNNVTAPQEALEKKKETPLHSAVVRGAKEGGGVAKLPLVI